MLSKKDVHAIQKKVQNHSTSNKIYSKWVNFEIIRRFNVFCLYFKADIKLLCQNMSLIFNIYSEEPENIWYKWRQVWRSKLVHLILPFFFFLKVIQYQLFVFFTRDYEYYSSVSVRTWKQSSFFFLHLSHFHLFCIEILVRLLLLYISHYPSDIHKQLVFLHIPGKINPNWNLH